ncbi:MAG: hypothetical protein K2Q01_01380, partial [Rickettsiales bacterium]|nr:hypothetical protein [Rickettsiales bacterium]
MSDILKIIEVLKSDDTVRAVLFEREKLTPAQAADLDARLDTAIARARVANAQLNFMQAQANPDPQERFRMAQEVILKGLEEDAAKGTGLRDPLLRAVIAEQAAEAFAKGDSNLRKDDRYKELMRQAVPFVVGAKMDAAKGEATEIFEPIVTNYLNFVTHGYKVDAVGNYVDKYKDQLPEGALRDTARKVDTSQRMRPLLKDVATPATQTLLDTPNYAAMNMSITSALAPLFENRDFMQLPKERRNAMINVAVENALSRDYASIFPAASITPEDVRQVLVAEIAQRVAQKAAPLDNPAPTPLAGLELARKEDLEAIARGEISGQADTLKTVAGLLGVTGIGIGLSREIVLGAIDSVMGSKPLQDSLRGVSLRPGGGGDQMRDRARGLLRILRAPLTAVEGTANFYTGGLYNAALENPRLNAVLGSAEVPAELQRPLRDSVYAVQRNVDNRMFRSYNNFMGNPTIAHEHIDAAARSTVQLLKDNPALAKNPEFAKTVFEGQLQLRINMDEAVLGNKRHVRMPFLMSARPTALDSATGTLGREKIQAAYNEAMLAYAKAYTAYASATDGKLALPPRLPRMPDSGDMRHEMIDMQQAVRKGEPTSSKLFTGYQPETGATDPAAVRTAYRALPASGEGLTQEAISRRLAELIAPPAAAREALARLGRENPEMFQDVSTSDLRKVINTLGPDVATATPDMLQSAIMDQIIRRREGREVSAYSAGAGALPPEQARLLKVSISHGIQPGEYLVQKSPFDSTPQIDAGLKSLGLRETVDFTAENTT